MRITALGLVARTAASLTAMALGATLALAQPTTGQPDACIGGERVRTVTAWGRSGTTFSPQPATTLAELQNLFHRYEADLRTVLANAGWEGNPDDLFATVQAAREGGATVTVQQVAPQTEFEWMAFRRNGNAACVRSIMWAGEEPFPAWKIVVVSDEVEYTFMAPQACMNLASEKGRRPIPPPTCSLKASFDPERDLVTVSGTTSGAKLEVTSISSPAGSVTRDSLTSAGSMTWTLEPTADGTYRFDGMATSASGRQTSTCSAEVKVARKRPVCSLATSVDTSTGLISLEAGGVGETSITGISLPDGTSGELSRLAAAGTGIWTFDPTSTLPKKPGDYSYAFSAVSRLHGFESTCDATATVTKHPRSADWILRGYGARLDSAGDRYHSSRVRPDGVQERADLAFGNGDGFGLGLERMLTPAWGLELDLLAADVDSHYMFDLDDQWESDTDSLDLTSLGLGLNYHMTPGKRVDFFIGAFISRVMYDDVTYRALGETFSVNFDDDFGLGAKLGLDVPFGWESPWAFSTSLRYLQTSADAEGANIDLDVDPLIGTVGIAYRF